MDPFTQRMLERAELRSKNLGITSTNKFPLGEYNQESTRQTPRQQYSPKKSPSTSKRSGTNNNTEPKSTSPKKVVQRVTTETKENVDLAVEINITTGPNIQVQVEVEEQEVDEEGNILSRTEKSNQKESEPMIRDSSRNRLQRLGAMYSETENLSSPIHRNEARFDDEMQCPETSSKCTKRIGKLTALANSINNWEDDSSHASYRQQRELSPVKNAEPKIVGTSPRINTGTIPKLNGDRERIVLDDVSKSILITQKTVTGPTNDKNIPSKQLKWDKTVMDALEMQGFQRRESTTSKLIYDYKESDTSTQDEPISKTQSVPAKPVFKTVSNTVEIPAQKVIKKTVEISKGLVSGRTAIFENQQKVTHSMKPQKDPAEMSIKERLALFERNKGNALIPKAALGMSASSKQIMGNTKEDKPAPLQEKPKVLSYNKPVLAESNASGNCIRNTVAALMSNATTISESQISLDIRKQREKEMNVLLNRFNKPNGDWADNKIASTPPPPPPPMPSHLQSTLPRHVDAKCLIKRKSNEKMPEDSSYQSQKITDHSKRIKVNPKEGRIYPILSDIESITTESDQGNCTTATISASEPEHDSYEDEDSYMEEADDSDGICDVSLGREIMQAVKRNDPTRPETREQFYPNNSQYLDSSTASDVSANVLGEIDDYLDEALEEDDEYDDEIKYEENLTPTKCSISSNSFSYAKSPAKQIRQQTIAEDDDEHCTKTPSYQSPIKSELTVNPSDDNNIVTLTHTVSFYRRQQSQSVSNTPIRKVTYADNRGSTIDATEDDDSDSESTNSSEDYAVQEKIKKLYDEVDKQHQIMKQTSQALNLCAATFEFSGSTESVEGERHLLVATHRREALLQEIERLRQQRFIRPPGSPQDRGRLIVRDVTVPLRQDYKEKLDSDTICGHHLVCLLKYNENVLASKTVPTLPGLLAVKFPDILQMTNVYADFMVTLEIYGMIAQREVLPHDIKYHINKKSGNKTPKGKKGADSRLVMPLIESAGGPNVIRTPGLSRYGVVEFSLREVQRSMWSMTKVTGVSPLHGNVHMKINCELSVSIDHKGFLTMFEDVAGFGAWHRRWCRLHGHLLSYWRYPDDEKKKAPMGSIDLKNCCTHKVAAAPRDVCARLNTLLLELKRPRQEDDKDSLVIVRHSNYTVIRHLLSADTKDERDIWCAHFNKALIVIRSWEAPH